MLAICLALLLAAGPVPPSAGGLPPLPVGPIVPPVPMPGPDAVTTVSPVLKFYFDFDQKVAVRVVPAGLCDVVVKENKGVRTFEAVFADAPEKGLQERDFVGKYVYHIVPKKNGPVTLLVIPFGLTQESDIQLRQLVITGTGVDPMPPPKPVDPTPKPVDPTPPAPPAQQQLSILVIEQDEDAALSRAALIASTDVAARVKARGHKMRVVDKDVTGPDKKTPPADLAPYLARSAGRALPQLFIVGKDGKVWFEDNLPAKPSDVLALITKYGG